MTLGFHDLSLTFAQCLHIIRQAIKTVKHLPLRHLLLWRWMTQTEQSENWGLLEYDIVQAEEHGTSTFMTP